MKVNDITAKLLAGENLTIIRASDTTAYFDTSTRVLSVPNWKDMTDTLETMFISHEVGHALFTTHDTWTSLLDSVDAKKRGTIKGYFNCVEDARIERLMKERYPGLRKIFFAGYKELIARDFFMLKGRDVNDLSFIDRANIHFKGGYSTGVKFNEEEMKFVRRIEAAQSIEEAFKLALECYEFAKKQKEDMRITSNFDDFGSSGAGEAFGEDEEDEDEDEEDDDSYNLPDEDEDEEDEFDNHDRTKASSGDASNYSKDDDDDDEDLASITDKALEDNLRDLADTSIKYRYYEMFEKSFRDPVVSYKTVLEDTKSCDSVMISYRESQYKTFMVDSERVVNYLVKEFEMRKSATAYKRSRISKTGSLNMNKLYAHSITDDIFKKITTIPNGKNHGMIFLLDWSGSMYKNLNSTIKQLINLVMFCRRINIPFEVYAFTSEYIRNRLPREKYYDFCEKSKSWYAELNQIKDKNVIFSSYNFSLLNFFSSKMSNREFNIIAKRMITGALENTSGYTLSSTPLNDALLHMLSVIPVFKKSNSIEKLSLVTLSDGAGDCLLTNNRISRIEYSDKRSIKCKNFINDPVTSKSYEIEDNSFTYTSVLLSMISSRYDVNTIGFFLCENRQKTLSRAVSDNTDIAVTYELLENVRTSMRKDGFYSLPHPSYTELFLINDMATKISTDNELEVDSSQSAASIARAVSKTMNRQRHSRIVLDRFIGHVA